MEGFIAKMYGTMNAAMASLDVEHDEIRSGIAKIADVAMRPVDHQVYIQKH